MFNRKSLHKWLKQKTRFELWFLVLLILVAVVSFMIADRLFNAVMRKVAEESYQVTRLDEKGVYPGLQHDLSEDVRLLTQPQPSLLNGTPIEQNLGRNQAIAVVVENYTPIRQTQEGLEKAAIVYEAPAEGGITRFLAIFDGIPVDSIGPVRSARPYFITWAGEYRAPFVHVGGSADALNNLKNNFRVFDIDEFADYVTIWRNKNYSAPHNAFTSILNILKRIRGDEYYVPMQSKRFPFKDDTPVADGVSTIVIGFSIRPYEAKYVYDPADNRYARYNGEERHFDLKPANILVQFVETEVLDDIGRLRIQTHGTGKALVFRDGTVIEGTWQKDDSINSPAQPMDPSFTKFFDETGKEIELNRGQIWIEIVPTDRAVNYF
jgi:hypothetical protein